MYVASADTSSNRGMWRKQVDDVIDELPKLYALKKAENAVEIRILVLGVPGLSLIHI